MRAVSVAKQTAQVKEITEELIEGSFCRRGVKRMQVGAEQLYSQNWDVSC